LVRPETSNRIPRDLQGALVQAQAFRCLAQGWLLQEFPIVTNVYLDEHSSWGKAILMKPWPNATVDLAVRIDNQLHCAATSMKPWPNATVDGFH
jgi:hypothetical protein